MFHSFHNYVLLNASLIYSFCSDINKRLPGPHFDPPSKDQIRSMMQVIYNSFLRIYIIYFTGFDYEIYPFA